MILLFFVSLLSIAAFGFALWKTRISSIANGSLTFAMRGLSSMMDRETDDNIKEVAIRRAGLSLLLASFSIAWRLAFAFLAAVVPIFLFDMIGIAPQEEVIDLMMGLDYIIIVSVVIIVLAKALKHSRFGKIDKPVFQKMDTQYPAADIFFHSIAFASPVVLKTAAAIENRFTKSSQQQSESPIFITSLARGGTTSLLNALSKIPGIATHTYRDMPFLTMPSLWNKLTGGNKRSVVRRKRSHGDGLEIDLDSPEAFDEVIWKIFWPKKFSGASISLWNDKDRNPDAEQFLRRHMRIVIHARSTQNTNEVVESYRYCSKNNANIARIPYLAKTFPSCHIVVPVRRPECHAASLMRQHVNFTDMHGKDEFIAKYMRDIGHYEFGLIHKPIQFPDFNHKTHDTTDANYWLNYWVCAFREVLKHKDKCIFVFQDDLRSSPQATMKALCQTLSLDPKEIKFEDYFHTVSDQSPIGIYDKELYKEAMKIYNELLKTNNLFKN